MALTALRKLSLELAATGVLTRFQSMPFHRSVTARSVPLLLLKSEPTAQTSWTETAATPLRLLVLDPAFGLGTIFQAALCDAAAASVSPVFMSRASSMGAITQTRKGNLKRCMVFLTLSF